MVLLRSLCCLGAGLLLLGAAALVGWRAAGQASRLGAGLVVAAWGLLTQAAGPLLVDAGTLAQIAALVAGVPLLLLPFARLAGPFTPAAAVPARLGQTVLALLYLGGVYAWPLGAAVEDGQAARDAEAIALHPPFVSVHDLGARAPGPRIYKVETGACLDRPVTVRVRGGERGPALTLRPVVCPADGEVVGLMTGACPERPGWLFVQIRGPLLPEDRRAAATVGDPPVEGAQLLRAIDPEVRQGVAARLAASIGLVLVRAGVAALLFVRRSA